MSTVGMKKSILDRDRGVVATYCPMCRDITAFTLRRLHQGIGVPHGWIVECTQCRFFGSTNPASWLGIADSASDLRKLISETNPEAYLHFSAQCSFDCALAEGRVPPTDRECEIRSTLASACGSFILTNASNRFSLWSAAAMGSGVLIALAGTVFTAHQPPASFSGMLGSGLIIAGVLLSAGGGIFSVVARKWRAARHARSLAAISLRPLAPTLPELETSIRHLSLAHPEILRFAKPRLLHAELAALTDQSWSNVTPDVLQAEAQRQFEARQAVMQPEAA